jgi:hypothetical protein
VESDGFTSLDRDLVDVGKGLTETRRRRRLLRSRRQEIRVFGDDDDPAFGHGLCCIICDLALRLRAAYPARRQEDAMIRGLHAMFYSSQAEELRAFLRDKLRLKSIDVGGGWLIFDAPEADLGVHPTEGNDVTSGTSDISFYCDDIEQTVSELKSRGVEFTKEVQDHGYGFVTYFKVPGGFNVQLYQPKYAK